jgi:hypothetical protein
MSPLSEKFLGHFSPTVPPSAVGFASVSSDAGGLLWRKLERSKSLVLLQIEGLACRWQRHSVKPSCWECSTTVEQAETQLRVVVPIEEEYINNVTSAKYNFGTPWGWNKCVETCRSDYNIYIVKIYILCIVGWYKTMYKRYVTYIQNLVKYLYQQVDVGRHNNAVICNFLFRIGIKNMADARTH